EEVTGLTVVGNAIDHFEVKAKKIDSSYATTFKADECFQVEVIAVDENDQVSSVYQGPKSLTWTLTTGGIDPSPFESYPTQIVGGDPESKAIRKPTDGIYSFLEGKFATSSDAFCLRDATGLLDMTGMSDGHIVNI